MDLSEDGRVVVATGDRDFVRVIPLDGRPSRDLPRADQRLSRAAVSADGRRVAALGRFDNRNEVRVWDLESDAVESLVLNDDTSWLRLWSSLEFSRDGQLFWSLDQQVWKWNPTTGDSSRVLPEGPRHFRISGDGRRLIGHSAIGGAGIELTGVFDLEDGSSIRLPGHGATVRDFALDSTGSVAVTGDFSGCLRIGSAAGGSPHLLTADASLVTAVDISPDGRWIASGHSDGAIRLWRTPDLDTPPLADLPHDEFLAKLKSLTNLRATPDPERPGRFRVRAIEPFAGWETLPKR
jgi:WD40 repeat protein